MFVCRSRLVFEADQYSANIGKEVVRGRLVLATFRLANLDDCSSPSFFLSSIGILSVNGRWVHESNPLARILFKKLDDDCKNDGWKLRPTSAFPPASGLSQKSVYLPLAQFRVEIRIHRSFIHSRLSANSFRGSQRFHKDEPTILSHPLVFSREKPPWCNPLAPSPPPPLFPRVETKTDGLPAAAPPPRARKHVYAALRDPRRIHPTRLSSTRSPFLPFFRRRTIYRSRSIRPSRLWSRIQTDGVGERLIPGFSLNPCVVLWVHPNHVFSFLLRSFLRRSSSFLYDGVCCDTNTKRTLGFNWLLSLTRVYLYMYICVCMYTYVYIYIVCTIYENRRDFIVCA